ncbi:bifunctional phosphopantothenoylcysteine decarboxylase/phosphopantothenate--cysteine ligase CoaBC [Alkalinema pantanalense CENA528]|uniref:bifunctional phosphopantothenoylcysteine decarboxylase/phosphopantothenate--cysteine ligase CoaBC n=1 Tax=Alkalinema pantanalense TaxID=1620705 RepID=UPI003D6F05E1
MLAGKQILIGIGGGIAAYKACQVVSTLAQAGAEVRVILTEAAQQFVTPLTLATLSRHPAYTDRDFWQPTQGRPLHIELGEWADLFVLMPLTANTLGKLTYGLADNLLTNTVLASTCPVLVAPAMNTDMWEQLAVQRNWSQLFQDFRYHAANPGAGLLACDRVGVGRMAEPEELLPQIQSLLYTQGRRDLSGKRILISAGGTREFLDPVRFLGNPSTGKMGAALALAALHRGAQVTFVYGSGTVNLALLKSAKVLTTPAAAEMEAVMHQEMPQADWIILCAAVADMKPAEYRSYKLPKAELPTSIPTIAVPDIAAGLAQRKQPQQRLIGFAAQTGDYVTPALEKLHRKGLDAIVANPIDQPNSGFGSDQNQAIICDRSGHQVAIEPCSKLEMAHKIFDFLQASNG